MNNNEIIEMNKKEKELVEKLDYVNGTVEQYKKQLREYKASHPEEFKDKNTQITDIHAIGSLKALKIEIANRDALQDEKDKIEKIKEEEKRKVQEKLDYVQETIKQYKKQLQEYKASHPKEFEDKNTQITDIHAIGSLKALRIEREKEKELQETMKLLESDEKTEVLKTEETKSEKLENKEEVEEIIDSKQVEELLNEEILEEKDASEMEEAQKVVKTSKGEVREESKENADLEIIDLKEEERKNRQMSNAVKVFYSAKRDKYVVENLNGRKYKILKRNSIEKIDKATLAEKYGKNVEDLVNVDINVFQILLQYDMKFKTSKASEYINTVTDTTKSKENMKNEMQKNKIEIVYNLKGLYDKNKFTVKERRELLDNANNAKNIGIAQVTKGMKVSIREFLERITMTSKTNRLAAGESEKEVSAEEVSTEDVSIEDVSMEEVSEKEEQKEFKKELDANIPLEKQRKYALEQQEKETTDNSIDKEKSEEVLDEEAIQEENENNTEITI